MQNIETDIVVYGNLRAEYAMLVPKTNVENRIEVLEALDVQITNQLNKIKFRLSGGLTNESAIEQLQKYFRDIDSALHVIVKSREEQTTGQWLVSGQPHSWMLAEVNGEHSVYIDVGYGKMVLFENGIIAGSGTNTITTQSAAVLDRDYYGVSKYIWK